MDMSRGEIDSGTTSLERLLDKVVLMANMLDELTNEVEQASKDTVYWDIRRTEVPRSRVAKDAFLEADTRRKVARTIMSHVTMIFEGKTPPSLRLKE